MLTKAISRRQFLALLTTVGAVFGPLRGGTTERSVGGVPQTVGLCFFHNGWVLRSSDLADKSEA